MNTHVWTDPNNKLYHDPKGPEKALNVCISSRILAFFVSSNRDKRKLNYNNIYSIQELSEEDHDERCLEYHDTYNFQEAFIDSQIKEIFEHKDYLKAFVLDSIVNKNCFDYDETTNETNFSLKKLKHQIRSLNTEYCEIFSHRYNLDPLKVEKSLDYVLNISYTNMDSKLNQVMTNLKYDRKFLNELRGF